MIDDSDTTRRVSVDALRRLVNGLDLDPEPPRFDDHQYPTGAIDMPNSSRRNDMGWHRRDHLTGLFSRQGFVGELSKRLCGNKLRTSVAVLAIRLRGLGAEAHHLGDDAHDDFLRAVSAALVAALGPASLVARIDGTDFLAAVHGRGDDASAVALAQCMHDGLVRHGAPVAAAAIGCVGSRPGDDAEQLVAKARQALLGAPADAPAVRVFTEQLAATVDRRREIARGLREAIERESLDVYYQPEVDLRTGRIEGVEALVRWHHPTLGLLLPDSFMDIVETLDLVDDLGRAVLRQACRDHQQWRVRGVAADLTLRVNVSPRQLLSTVFITTVTAAVAEFDLDPRRLCLEITESAAVHDVARSRSVLSALTGMGVTIALDDFGTGFNAFAHLKHLQVDTVKIDRSFVRHLASNADDRRIAASITSLARSFGMQVVAEGVEDVDAARILMELGCLCAQGFLYSPPVPPDELERMLAAPPDWSMVETGSRS